MKPKERDEMKDESKQGREKECIEYNNAQYLHLIWKSGE